MTDQHFGRYLLGELLWELYASHLVVPAIQSTPLEEIEVLSYAGYARMRVRVAAVIFDIQLSWRGDVPPIIEVIEPVTEEAAES